ncbi:retron Ec67 family RNA-directed DNA polymerase/endonuclease [Paraburkholderia fungorum]|nr:retron Ec67 family RNA-directed DNA polymerase/endonuclease [Paraburkholderia fungorum]
MLVPEITTLERFQAAHSREALANLLDIKHQHLTYLLYVKKDAGKYATFSIPKRSGGTREIRAPIKELKSLQRRLANRLQNCISDVSRITGRENQSSHGFCPNKSILTNASAHRNKRYVLNLDLQDFFPTITGQRIRGFLINDRNFKFHRDVATTIAHIACVDGVLPQGSPCSPVISNLIAGILDSHLSRLAQKNGCHYTRYADDITFSTNKKEFPSQIGFLDKSTSDKWVLGKELRRLVALCGFVINDGKTRMQCKNSRQQVTGLVVNEKVNVTSEYRHLVRAYVFSLVNRGSYKIRSTLKGGDGNEIVSEKDGTPEQLHGMLGFIHSVDSVFRTELKNNPHNHLPPYQLSGKTTPDPLPLRNLTIYRKFLLYTRFYRTTTPLVVCEGKTDIVYISSAVHQSKAVFPQLIKKNDAGKDILAFQFFKYDRKHKKKEHVYMPNFSTAAILGVASGGGPNLSNLIRTYHKESKKFQSPCGDKPVVFVVDNDSGATEVLKAIKDCSGKACDRDDPFIHVFGNLYVVLVPRNGLDKMDTEGLFSPLDLAKGHNGKTFDFSKDADSSTSVGKAPFAFEFVAPKAKELDWTGFHPLLANIIAAFDHYKGTMAAIVPSPP